MTIIQASFFWKNDKPGGLGFTLGPPTFSPEELTEMFEDSVIIKEYVKDSDDALGSSVVRDYLAQLEAIAQLPKHQISLQQAILAALNILWLSNRGFIPNDEFNGVQFIRAMK